MSTGKVITALVYDSRPINEIAQSQLARLPDGTTQLDAIVVTADSITKSQDYKANISIVGTGTNNGTAITTRARSGVGNGEPEWSSPRKAGGALGEIVADIAQTWEIDWDPEAEHPWGGGIFSGIQVRPQDNFLWAGVDLTIHAAPGGVVNAAVILIARNDARDTLDWPGIWTARAS